MRVIKLPLILFLISFYINPCHAQDEKNKSLKGIRIGYHRVAQFTENDMLDGTEPMSAFYIGIFRDTKIISLLRYGTGLEYFQNGSKVDDDNRLVLHTLSIPVNLKAKIGPAYALTGFAPSFIVAERVIIEGDKSKPDDKSKIFDAPFFLGAGLKMAIMSVEARYHWGIVEVRDGTTNRYFQVGIALSF